MSLPPCTPLKEFGAVFMCAVSQDPGDIQFPIQTQAIEKLKGRFLWISPVSHARTCNMNEAFGSFVLSF